jgi:cell division protein FtsZ
MAEINLVMERINDKCSGAQVVMGAAIDEQFGARLAVTVVAGRRGEPPPAPAGQDEAARPASRTGGRGDDLNNRLVNRVDTPRPQSRFVPPPPTLPQEKIDQLLPEAAGATRRRKGSPRMRQGQLPLEIVSKGRFDKSEPTIHKGEDLDVPTYIRRGVSLN